MNVVEKARLLASSFIKDNMGFEVEPDDLMVEDVNFTGNELCPDIIHSVWVTVYDKEKYSYDIDFDTNVVEIIDNKIPRCVIGVMNFTERRLPI